MKIRPRRGGAGTISHVIHAVGPDYREADQQRPQLLYDAHYSVLREAHQLGITTVAIPQISTAIVNLPEQRATRWAARALRDAQTNVREIRFILYNRGDADALQIADWMFEGAPQERTRPTHALTAPRRPTAPAVSAGPAARPAPAALHPLAHYQARVTAFRNPDPPALPPRHPVARHVFASPP